MRIQPLNRILIVLVDQQMKAHNHIQDMNLQQGEVDDTTIIQDLRLMQGLNNILEMDIPPIKLR